MCELGSMSTAWGPSVPEQAAGVLTRLWKGEDVAEGERQEALKAIAAAYECYHPIELVPGFFLPAPEHRRELHCVLKTLERLVEPGASVLDIGCRDGWVTAEARRLGASRMVAVDNDYSAVFDDIVRPWYELDSVDYRIENYLDMAESESFDVVVFAGVLYHLRYPMYGLKKVKNLTRPGGRVLLETAFTTEFEPYPVLFCPIGDESPYEPSSVTFFNRTGLRDTIMSLGMTVESVEIEFTHECKMPSRFKELPMAQGDGQVIGRLVWVLRNTEPVIEKWTHPDLPPARVRPYWDTKHNVHHK